MAAPPDDFQTQDSAWAHFKIMDSSGKKLKCNWCGKEIKGGGITRGKQHLAGITGQVKKCDVCPREVSDEFRALLLGYKSQKQKMTEQQAELREKIASRKAEKGKGLATSARGVSIHERGDPTHRPRDDSSDTSFSSDSDPELAAARKASMHSLQEDEARREGVGTSGTGRIGRTETSASGRTVAAHTRAAVRERSAKQSGADEALKGLKGMKGAVKGAMKGIVKWFVHAGIPVSKASSPYFGEMIKGIAQAGPEMPTPTGDMILSWAAGDPIDIYDQPFEPARHSEEMAETPRLHTSDTPLRRAASQVDRRKVKEVKEPRKKKQKQKQKQKPQAKQSEEQPIGLTEDTPMDTPPLPPQLAQLYEKEQKYRRRKKQAQQEEVGKSRQKISRHKVGSDDSTQAPSDGDDDAAAAAALTGATFQGQGSGYQESHQPDIEHEEGQGSGQGQEGGYEGQQRGAGTIGYDWGYGGPYPFFHPPRLAYSDISSTSRRGDGHSQIQSGQPSSSARDSDFTFPTAIITPSGESRESSSQINTPRGVTRGVHELADSIFGFGHRQTFGYGGYCNPDDEGSRM